MFAFSGWHLINLLIGLIIVGAAIGVIVALVNNNRKHKAARVARPPLDYRTVMPAPVVPAPTAPASTPAGPPATDPATALATLDDLRAKSLITDAEYAELRAKIIDRLA